MSCRGSSVCTFIPIFFCSQITQEWVVSHSQITRKSVIKPSYEVNVSTWEKFHDWLGTHLRLCWMTYKAPEWITTNLQGTYDWKRIQLQVDHSRLKLTSFTAIQTVENSHGTYRFQWRVPPNYCEYSGVRPSGEYYRRNLWPCRPAPE